MSNIYRLLTSIVLCHSAGIIGSLFTRSAISGWYQDLNKPFFNPPNWAFAPVWLTLYTLMGIALYRIWQKGLGKEQIRFAFGFFLIHLFFNALWSVVFFGLQNIFAALIIILILWFMILALVYLFFKEDKLSGILLVPYFLWVSFAAFLNAAIWLLNL